MHARTHTHPHTVILYPYICCRRKKYWVFFKCIPSQMSSGHFQSDVELYECYGTHTHTHTHTYTHIHTHTHTYTHTHTHTHTYTHTHVHTHTHTHTRTHTYTVILYAYIDSRKKIWVFVRCIPSWPAQVNSTNWSRIRSKHIKGSKEHLFIRTQTHNLQILRVIPFVRLQNNV